jgi:hypothetical protein
MNSDVSAPSVTHERKTCVPHLIVKITKRENFKDWNSGNIDSSMPVLLLKGGIVAARHQGDALMKVNLTIAALIALTASPLFAQSQSTEGPSHSGIYRTQKKLLSVDFHGPDGSARKFNQATSNPDPMKHGLCGTASGFCPDYHGGNGG